MVEVAVHDRGSVIIFRLPDDRSARDFISHVETKLGAKGEIRTHQKTTNLVAPLQNHSGAQVAQIAAPDDVVPPKGGRANGAGAPLRPLTRRSPARHPPSRDGTKARRTDRDRIEYYRSEVRTLAAEKAKLAPAFDSHDSVKKSVKAALLASFEQHPNPVVMSEQVRAYRKSLYAKQLDASERWGADAGRFKDISAMIKTLSGEIERLERVP